MVHTFLWNKDSLTYLLSTNIFLEQKIGIERSKSMSSRITIHTHTLTIQTKIARTKPNFDNVKFWDQQINESIFFYW